MSQSLDHIFEALTRSQAIIEFQPDGTILQANDNFLTAMGYSLDDIVGKHHRMFVHEDYGDSAEYLQFWDTLRSGEFHSGEYCRVTKSGADIWIQASYNPVFDDKGTLVKIVKFATDITAQKYRAAEVESILSAIDRSQATIEFELDGTILHANENFLATVGYSLGDIVGKHHRIFMNQNDAQSDAYKAFWQNLAAGKPFTGEVKRKARNGDPIYLHASYNPVLDARGQPVKVIKVATDVTETALLRLSRDTAIAGIEDRLVEMAKATGLATEKSVKIAQASNETTDVVEAVSSVADEFAKSVGEIRERITEVMQIAEKAYADAQQTSVVIDELSKDATKIGEIINLIEAIAKQTNLLALNATIESARAGEAGRGFAIVANEVKSLATQTADATQQISEQILTVQGSTDEAVQMITDMGETISQINGATTTISAAVEEQTTATDEVVRNMKMANSGVSELTGAVHGVAFAIKTIDEMADGIRGYAESIAKPGA